jgi:hypothetical protein
MPEPSPEASADARKALDLILGVVAHLKRRQQANAARVTDAIAGSVFLGASYESALFKGDDRWANTLAFTTAGFLTSFMKRQTGARLVVARLMYHRDNAWERAWSQGILDAMAEAGVIRPNP